MWRRLRLLPQWGAAQRCSGAGGGADPGCAAEEAHGTRARWSARAWSWPVRGQVETRQEVVARDAQTEEREGLGPVALERGEPGLHWST
ncbi:hypothetical protein NDU88_003313 [Pleurodeles waltl]|uniref:Uncharacterized protein n=1 Tax=Pleurodeles waltl TaxID=8319 RepID=A0AAV7VHI2_PLEWA|nr:hypothetical protein NDU88_003313 [Pleurodeles waltl]